MVEIREETDETSNNGAGSSSTQQNGSTGTDSTNSPPTSTSLINFYKANKMDLLLFVLRILTVYFSLLYLLPISSAASQKDSYIRAFIAAGATNAFRLHQRLSGTSIRFFSQEFLRTLLLEDSAHYLFYCLVFVTTGQVTMALVPIALYSLLHSLNFAIKSAAELGYGNTSLVTKIRGFVQQNTGNVLSMIACAEIAIFPIIFPMIFLGKANLFVPFIYFRFLSCRYISRRNPYTRQTFANIKMSIYNFASNQSCPAVVRNGIYKVVQLIERFAPQ